jgi:hypothetical protein
MNTKDISIFTMNTKEIAQLKTNVALLCWMEDIHWATKNRDWTEREMDDYEAIRDELLRRLAAFKD